MLLSPGFIKRLPKSDLHSHIDGSVPFKDLMSIARGQRVKVLTSAGVELSTPGQLAEHVKGPGYQSLLEDVVERFFPIVGIMQSEEALREVGAAYVGELKRHNVVYAEGRFAPQYHTREGMTRAQAIKSMSEGLRQGSETHGVTVKLIVAIGRETDSWTASAVAREAVSSRRAVALDLGGPEAGNPPTRFTEAFRIAEAGGLRKTVHAGEGAGSLSQNLANIRSSIEGLKVQRVGHALDLSKDASLEKLCVENSVTIEMNPTSNLTLGKIADLRDLGIDSLLDSGVRVTVNSDDPALWPKGSINEVLADVCNAYGFGVEQLDLLITNSFRGSFAPASEVGALLEEYSSARAGLA